MSFFVIQKLLTTCKANGKLLSDVSTPLHRVLTKQNKEVVMELDERKKQILYAVIKTYLETGEPVGSRTLSKYSELNVSPATIRNEMADLEDLGYLMQPHTSAGRIPSDKGYRFYVDELMADKEREVDEMKEILDSYKDKFESVAIAEPLLGEVGSDATVINEDKKAVAVAITEEAIKAAGYDSADAASEDGVAFVFMGHGTSHTAKVSYSQMQTQMNELGYKNVFIGTVEGEPEETACENVIEAVMNAGYKKVILRPLMVVAGDHANNDMAGDDDDSWKSMFVASGAFDSVDVQIKGLGGIEAIQALYVAHTGKVIK